MENNKKFCPMINGDCKGGQCMWYDAELVEGCITHKLHNSVLHVANQIKELRELTKDALNHFYGYDN